MGVTIDGVLTSVNTGYLLIKTGNTKGAFELAGEVEAALKEMQGPPDHPFKRRIRTYLEDLRSGGTLNRHLNFMIYMGVHSFTTD